MFASNVAIGPDFSTRVNSLIDVAHQEGRLIKLCSVLADVRPDNERVSSEIIRVQEWLKDQRNINDINEDFRPEFTAPVPIQKLLDKSPFAFGRGASIVGLIA